MSKSAEPQNYNIYSHLSVLRTPSQLVRGMWVDLKHCYSLAWELFRADFSARYRESFLGLFWAIVPPVLLALSFTLAQRAAVFSVSITEIPYPAYVMLSICLWQVFSDALGAPQIAFTQAKPFLTKVSFPRESLFLAKLYDVFLNFLIRLTLIAGAFIYYEVPFQSTMLLAPIGVLALTLLGFGLGLLLVPLGALVDDISRALTVFASYLMFLAPVVYPLPQTGMLATIVRWNPVTPLLMTTREWIVGAPVTFPVAFVVTLGLTLVALIIAWVISRISMPFLVERLGA